MDRTPKAPRITLDIDAELVASSTKRDSSHCMIAEAVRAAYPDASHVAVDLQTIRFSDHKKGLRYTYLTPRVGQVALVNFDQGVKPAPFQLWLRGGQVTRAGRRHRTGQSQTSAGKAPTSAQVKQRRKWAEKGRAAKAQSLSSAKLQSRSGTGMVLDRVGGRTPPTTAFARRREFGLRALGR